MKSKSGKAVNAVNPIAPEAALDADEANPGKVAKLKVKQQESQSGKYGSTKVKPYTPPSSNTSANESDAEDDVAEDEPTSFIEVELQGEQGNAVAGMKYEIELPDGKVAKGTLDSNGYVKLLGIQEGDCKITFPDLDKQAWR